MLCSLYQADNEHTAGKDSWRSHLGKASIIVALINGDESGEFTTITPFLKKWQKKEENCYTKRKERYKVTDNQQDPFLLISKQVLLLALIDGIDRLQLRGLEL